MQTLERIFGNLMVHSANVKSALVVWHMWRKVALKVLAYNKFIWGYSIELSTFKILNDEKKILKFIHLTIVVH